MKNVLVHIGYHKTGTTWMQRELFDPKSEVFIPLSKNTSKQSSLAQSFIYDKEGYLLNSFDENEEEILDALKVLSNEINFDENKVMVMSHERLSGNPQSSGFDSSIIAKRIKNIFPDAKILIVIREQSSWILSNYFQYLSMGGTHGLKKYLNLKYDGKRPGFSPTHVEYHHLIQGYQRKFGQENVLILPFELLNSDHISFINKIESFIEKKISIEAIDFKKRYNSKKRHFISYKLRSLNRLIYSSSVNNNSSLYNKFYRLLARAIVKIMSLIIPNSLNKTCKNKLAKEIKEWSNDRYDNSNRIIQDMTGLNLEKLGYKTGMNIQPKKMNSVA